MSDINNVNLGVCKIYVDGVDLGHTIGGAELMYEFTEHVTRVDQYAGEAERWLTEEKLSVKCTLAESTLANILKAMTYATDQTDHVTLGSQAGKRASNYTAQIRMHPISLIDSDASRDVFLHKAASSQPVTLPFKNDGEEVMEVTFSGLVDEARTDGDYLGLIGDSDA